MTTNHEPHPIELLLAAAWVALEAAAVLLVALVAMLLTLAGWRPSQRQAPPPPPPLIHPLALVAADLEALPVTRLRPMAGTRSKRARKAELVAALVAC
jgi:hypothetical protein